MANPNLEARANTENAIDRIKTILVGAVLRVSVGVLSGMALGTGALGHRLGG